MNPYRHLLGLLLGAGPGFGIGGAVYLIMDIADWPVAIAGPRGAIILLAVVGAAAGGLLGVAFYPHLRHLSQSYSKPGTQEAIGMWGLLTWESGIRGPLIVAGCFGTWVGGVAGGLSGDIFGNSENGAFLGGWTGMFVGIILAVVAVFIMIAIAWIIRPVIRALRSHEAS